MHLFMIYLYTKYHLNPSNHQWENERKLIFKTFLSPWAITLSIIFGLHPYSNLICISSWYICIPNIIWSHISNHQWENEWKLSLSRVWWTDGRTTERISPHHKTSGFQRAYNKNIRVPPLVLMMIIIHHDILDNYGIFLRHDLQNLKILYIVI
jgi:hypothetical protein